MANKREDVFKHIDMSGGPDACWQWKQKPGAGKGRGKPRPYFSVAGRKYLAYRLVYELVHGVELTQAQMIRHTCDNPLCCNPKHMLIGDHDDNMQDMVERDRHGLPSHVVRAIRKLLAEGRTHQSIADLYGISKTVVTRINTGEAHTGPNDYPEA